MKTVIITGANGNLGAAVSREFLDKGYKVIATIAKPTMQEDLAPHGNLVTKVVDLMDETATATFIDEVILQYKKVDAAIMLVGGFAMGNIQATSGDNIKQQMALNFDTAYYVTRPLFSHMQKNNNGRLVYIGARPAIDATFGKNLIAYGLSKAMLFKLAEYVNETAKGTNVSATVIAPSTLDTELNRKSMPDANPDNWVKPEALAEIMEFIVSDKGSVLRETVLKTYNNS